MPHLTTLLYSYTRTPTQHIYTSTCLSIAICVHLCPGEAVSVFLLSVAAPEGAKCVWQLGTALEPTAGHRHAGEKPQQP